MNLYLCRLYNQMKKNILITGGAGFIGSHVVRLMVTKYPEYQIFNLDALTYAGNLENLKDIEQSPNYHFIKANILEADSLKDIFEKHAITDVIHLAAESHVDRSITDPLAFVRTNVIGTVNLLQAAKKHWAGKMEGKRFYHISTDEVYGELHDPKEFFLETTSYDPRSPYSASKASSDHFVRAYHETYGLNTVVTRGSNTFGPYQYPEKAIPLFTTNLLDDKKIPLYGDGLNERDWLYVDDHCTGVHLVLEKGNVGEIYNIGAGNETANRVLVDKLLALHGKDESSVNYVADRLGHDRRYSVDIAKITALGWKRKRSLDEALDETVKWYRDNRWWWEPLKGKK